tara:strand:- start:5865 stop:5999 length:135 start_codon:yes stop_codon:yes gene_type:complete
MMTKLTDCLVDSDCSSFGAREKSEAFRQAWLGAKEASLLGKKYQ